MRVNATSSIRRKHRLLASILIVCMAAVTAAPALARSPQEKIARANQLANNEQFDQAIPIYERVLKAQPDNAQLKRNLIILYVNYGVTLQNQKRYDEAVPLFEKALALNPEDRHARRGLAGNYFNRSMDMREAGSTDYAAMRSLIEKAIALNPEEPVFKRAMASVYFDEAIALAYAANYAEAAELLEKALRLQPDDPAIRTSLVNMYLAQQQYDKALALDNSPEMHAKVERLKNPPETAAQASAGPQGFPALSAGENKLPRQAAKLNISEMLLDIENQLGIARDTDATLIERIALAEEQVYGEDEAEDRAEAPLADRVRDLYAGLMGNRSGMVAQSRPDLRQAPAFASEHSYLDKIFEMTDGKVLRWGKFPIRVFIDTPDEEDPEYPLYKDEYRNAVIRGLDVWKDATGGQITTVVVDDRESADTVFLWGDVFIDRYTVDETLHDTYSDLKVPKPSKLATLLQVAAAFTPGIYGLAPQALSAAMNYRQLKKLEVIREESMIVLGLNPLQDLPPDEALTYLQNMAAEQFGHVLGLKAHSDKPGDLMHPGLKSDTVQQPTHRDITTLSELYSRPANIILNVR